MNFENVLYNAHRKFDTVWYSGFVYSPYITVNILLLHPLLIFKQSFSVRSLLSDHDGII